MHIYELAADMTDSTACRQQQGATVKIKYLIIADWDNICLQQDKLSETRIFIIQLCLICHSVHKNDTAGQQSQ